MVMGEHDEGATPQDAARHLNRAAKQLKDHTNSSVERASAHAAGGLETVAETLQRASEELSAEHAFFSACLEKSATAVRSAAGPLAKGDLDSGLKALSEFARRDPALYLGASFAAGLAIARLGKGAAERLRAGAQTETASRNGVDANTP